MDRRLHFILLAGAMGLWVTGPTVVRWLDWGWLEDLFTASWPRVFFSGPGLAGAIYASTVAIAVRAGTSVGRKIAFVLMTDVLAFFIFLSAFYISVLGKDLFFGVMAASAGGAAAYWWLIRKVLLSTLPKKALIRAIWACPLATVAASSVSKPLGADAFTLLWWLAFSLCLTVGMPGPMTANKSVQPTGENPPAADAAR